jgi:hypothetical protein
LSAAAAAARAGDRDCTDEERESIMVAAQVDPSRQSARIFILRFRVAAECSQQIRARNVKCTIQCEEKKEEEEEKANNAGKAVRKKERGKAITPPRKWILNGPTSKQQAASCSPPPTL